MTNIDWGKTAVLIMDYQNDIVGMLPEEKQKSLLGNASKILSASREQGIPVIYIVVRFRNGYPEVCHRNKGFSLLKNSERHLSSTSTLFRKYLFLDLNS